jgi:hypothetical protein
MYAQLIGVSAIYLIEQFKGNHPLAIVLLLPLSCASSRNFGRVKQVVNLDGLYTARLTDPSFQLLAMKNFTA